MKKLFCSFYVLLLFATGYGSIGRIVDLNLFNIVQIDPLEEKHEKFVLNSIDSLRKAECVDTFIYELEIQKIYKLTKLPCIQIYAIEDGRRHTGCIRVGDQYENFLFNSCDSTIYPFGGGYIRFSKFIKSYLPLILNKGDDAIKDLINLYLNSMEQGINYYILTSPKNIEYTWNSHMWCSIDRRLLPDDEFADEVDEVSEKIRMFEILKEDGYYKVLASTWNDWGNIENWTFKISNNVFEVNGPSIRLLKKGPCY